MTRADRILLFLVLAALPFLYLHLWSEPDAATLVRITVTGNEPVMESLTPDRTITAQGPLGESIIEINHGRARFVSSPCSGQVCVHTGWLDTGGAIAACLPNRISIQLLGRYPRFDAINF
ncbi:MAG: NusG domain II-containing protein [Gammaproteobacteria bacterium]|jgi:hypothetical protein